MSLILHIETATKVCSVALSDSGKLLALEEIADDAYAHGEQLTVLIQKAVSQSGKQMSDLSAVSVTSGPGSYTGLRIGVSTAKGLCYALGIPLIAVNALESMAALAHVNYPGKNLLPMIDARRMEVYSLICDKDLAVLKPLSADVIDGNSYSEFEPFVYFGDGAAKMTDSWMNRDCYFDADLRCSAAGQVTLAFDRFNANEFGDVAYFEPLYLKEFQGTAPKSKM